MTEIPLSRLSHTWLIDIDGTIVKHNGHLAGCDEVLPGVHDFWAKIPKDDMIVLLTARTEEHQSNTLELLQKHGLRFDRVLFSLPAGERILINDIKPQGLKTAVAINLPRDSGLLNVTITSESIR